MVSTLQQARPACSTCGTELREDRAGGLCISCLAVTLVPPAAAHGLADDATTPELPAGFVFVAPLGRGGMGQVHLAYQPALRRYVALKQIAGCWRDQPKSRERFIREAQAAARLSHPGIVPVLEISGDAECVWYTMEFVEGGDLAELLVRRGGRLPWREAVAIVEATGRALDHAHRAGVAHRDLKPSNVMIDTDGNPKIADFGLAWLAADDGNALTLTGEVLGTPAYLAPECVASREQADARAGDIYSLCALLFHLVAGRPPFTADTPLQVLHAITHEPAPRLRQCAADAAVPAWLDRLCAHGLEKRPEDRIASAHDLATALAEHRELPGHRQRRRFALAAVALVGMAALCYQLSRPAPRPPPIAESAATAAPRIAVLPLEVPGDVAALGALAAGLQDELAATLLRVSDLRVITAGSVRAAGIAHGDFRAAHETLGAAAVLTGSVRQANDRLRISVQLLDPREGAMRWTKNYDRRETDLFNVQTDIATDVALQLRAQLHPRAADRIQGTSSRNPAAQRLFLEGRALAAEARQPEIDLRRAGELFAEAGTRDAGFALAFAHRSLVETRLYLWGHDRSEQRLATGLDAAQEALRINPDLPEAEIALALYYYRRSRDRETARAHVDRALALAPHNADVLAALANLERRDGAFEKSVEHFQAALELDPVNGVLAYNAADTVLRLRRYPEADAIMSRVLARLTGNVPLTKLRGDLHLLWHGDLAPMRADLATRDPTQPSPEIFLMHKIDWLVLEGKVADALQALRASRLDVLDAQSIYANREGYEALLLQLAGDRAGAAAAARTAYARLAPELERLPNDPRLLLHAGQLQAILGDAVAGERLARRPITRDDPACVDAFDRGFFLVSLAILLAGSGEDASAREVLRTALHEPNQVSLEYVRHHPALARFASENL